MPNRTQTLTEQSNQAIGITGRYEDVAFLKQRIEEQVIYDLPHKDGVGGMCYHVPMGCVHSDRAMEVVSNGLTTAILLSRYATQNNAEILDSAVEILKTGNPQSIDYARQQLGELSEAGKVLHIPVMAFRNTLEIMSHQRARFNADDFLRVASHGFAFVHGLPEGLINKNNALASIVRELESASTLVELDNKQDEAVKMLYGAYTMRHCLPASNPEKYERIPALRDRLTTLGFKGELNLPDQNPHFKSEAVTGRPSPEF